MALGDVDRSLNHLFEPGAAGFDIVSGDVNEGEQIRMPVYVNLGSQNGNHFEFEVEFEEDVFEFERYSQPLGQNEPYKVSVSASANRVHVGGVVLQGSLEDYQTGINNRLVSLGTVTFRVLDEVERGNYDFEFGDFEVDSFGSSRNIVRSVFDFTIDVDGSLDSSDFEEWAEDLEEIEQEIRDIFDEVEEIEAAIDTVDEEMLEELDRRLNFLEDKSSDIENELEEIEETVEDDDGLSAEEKEELGAWIEDLADWIDEELGDFIYEQQERVEDRLEELEEEEEEEENGENGENGQDFVCAEDGLYRLDLGESIDVESQTLTFRGYRILNEDDVEATLVWEEEGVNHEFNLDLCESTQIGNLSVSVTELHMREELGEDSYIVFNAVAIADGDGDASNGDDNGAADDEKTAAEKVDDLEDEFKQLEEDFEEIEDDLNRARRNSDDRDIEREEDNLEELKDDELDELDDKARELRSELRDLDRDLYDSEIDDLEELREDISNLEDEIDSVLDGESRASAGARDSTFGVPSTYNRAQDIPNVNGGAQDQGVVFVDDINIPAPTVVEGKGSWSEVRVMIWIIAGIVVFIALIVFLIAMLMRA